MIIIYKFQNLCQLPSCSIMESIAKFVKMIALLLLCLSVSSISSHPMSGGKACSTLTSFQKSLNNAVNPTVSHLCRDSQPKSKYFVHQAVEIYPFFFSAECTTAFLEILKKCLDGIKVDAKCLSEVYEVCGYTRMNSCTGTTEFFFRICLGTRPASVEDSSSFLKC